MSGGFIDITIRCSPRELPLVSKVLAEIGLEASDPGADNLSSESRAFESGDFGSRASHSDCTESGR